MSATSNKCELTTSWADCKPWDMAQQPRTNCLADGLAQEALNIAGAVINVFKLLGIHEQTKLIDLTGDGSPISGGYSPHYPASNAFNTLKTEWHSLQTGPRSILASAYIGYDFGVVKIPEGRRRYGIDAPLRQLITAIKIKQSSNPLQRIPKIRVERSENAVEWYGVSVLTLPNDDLLNVLHFKHSVPSRYWRIRPVGFVGGNCDTWGIQALEMYDYSVTHISNIQDKILLENRDRDYSETSLQLKGFYDLINVNTDLTRFGIELPSANYQIKINFNACVFKLGRPIVVGDILELPSETQYTPDLKPIKRFLEVTDVTWDANSYTPGWQPTMLLITAQPALASQETQDIFGTLAKNIDSSGVFDKDDGNDAMYQDFSNIDQTIRADAKTAVPELGSEGSNTIREFSAEDILKAKESGISNINKLGFNKTALFVEDAMPQNGANYTESSIFPNNPKDGEYHRLTYTGLAKNVPARLHRWSQVKGRWIYLETDRREQFNNQKNVLEEYTNNINKQSSKNLK